MHEAARLIEMHRTDHSRFRKRHDFVPDFSHAERRTRIVIGVTAAMMVVEIAVGLMSHSMALLADGWHMSTHVLAFLITAAAYYFANTSRQRAIQFRHGKNRCAWRIHQRGRALDRGVLDGGRIRAPALCSTGNSFQ